MKNFTHICFAFIMMIACSVGFANASPPKTTAPFLFSIVPTVQSDVINSDVIAIHNPASVQDVTVIRINENKYSTAKEQSEAITSKEAVLPSPKVVQLSKYIHYNLITNYSIKKITPRARSSDIQNQIKRC